MSSVFGLRLVVGLADISLGCVQVLKLSYNPYKPCEAYLKIKVHTVRERIRSSILAHNQGYLRSVQVLKLPCTKMMIFRDIL